MPNATIKLQPVPATVEGSSTRERNRENCSAGRVSEQQPSRGLSASLTLFAMSLGMGVPLLIVGSSAGRWMPRAGAWMDSVKRLFGALMLALAAWMLGRIVPARWTLLLFTPQSSRRGRMRLSTRPPVSRGCGSSVVSTGPSARPTGCGSKDSTTSLPR